MKYSYPIGITKTFESMKSLNALRNEHSKTPNYQSSTDNDKKHSLWSFSVVKCDKLNTTANVIMSGCGRGSNSYGDKCLFYCKHGYKAVSGTKERHCQENGTWSGSPLTCAGKLLDQFFFKDRFLDDRTRPGPRPGSPKTPKLFGSIKSFLVYLHLKTEKCICLKLLP